MSSFWYILDPRSIQKKCQLKRLFFILMQFSIISTYSFTYYIWYQNYHEHWPYYCITVFFSILIFVTLFWHLFFFNYRRFKDSSQYLSLVKLIFRRFFDTHSNQNMDILSCKRYILRNLKITIHIFIKNIVLGRLKHTVLQMENIGQELGYL